jgi:hypothetical protein
MKIKRSTFDLWKKRLTIFLGACFIYLLFYIYFATHLFTITSYELVGVPDMYKDLVNTNLTAISSQKIIKVIPGNRVFSYHCNQIKQSIVGVLPNTMKITLMPVGLHTIRVKVIPYKPFFKIDDTHGITKDGVIYSEFKDMSTLITLSLATSSVRQELNNDGIISVSVAGIDETKLGSISSLINKINSLVFLVKKIDIDSYGDISLFDGSGKSKIVFAGTQDTEKVWSNLLSAIDTDPLKEKLTTYKDKLEYLDARFGNKVFYKFTNDTKTTIIKNYATTTTSTTTTPATLPQ